VRKCFTDMRIRLLINIDIDINVYGDDVNICVCVCACVHVCVCMCLHFGGWSIMCTRLSLMWVYSFVCRHRYRCVCM